MMHNHGRGYDMTGTYWHVDDFRRFSNVMVHSASKTIKYFTCVNCGSQIFGFQLGDVIRRFNRGHG